jgi:hypothetical protein
MKRIGAFTLHALIAMVLTVLVGLMLAAPIDYVIGEMLGTPPSLLRRIALDVPYSPLSWVSAMVCGFLVNRRTRDVVAQWVWIVGVIWLTLWTAEALRFCGGCSILDVVQTHFFSIESSSCSSEECLYQLLATTPMLNSVAYSLGAVLAFRTFSSVSRGLTSQS